MEKKKVKGWCIDCGESPKIEGDRCADCAILYCEEIRSEGDLEDQLDMLLKDENL